VGGGGANGDGGVGGGGGAPVETLSSTGLFTSIDQNGDLVLGESVQFFEPLYWLWSDGSDKARWVYLPPGATIDATDPDHWELPVGTKFWKEFAPGGGRVETRLIERTGEGPEDFRFTSYQWMTPDATDATLVHADGQRNASGTEHHIPSEVQCHRCHDGLDERALGFSAIQLNHDLPGVTLQSLNAQNLLVPPVSMDVQIPGTGVTQEALGYLHANCGNCHNDTPGIPLETLPEPQMYLRVLTTNATPESTWAYTTAVNQELTQADTLGLTLRISGGDPAMSAVSSRMSIRFSENQMPPIATEMVDAMGSATVNAWIETLAPAE
jgi:hypothetical protein